MAAAPAALRVTELTVNGTRRRCDADAERILLDVLRDDLNLTGTKYGCGEAQCGACMVLADGKPTISCVTPVGAVRGKTITTIEGLERDGRLHPLQQAFLDEGAMQCGYCIPGMIMSGVALLSSNPFPIIVRCPGAAGGTRWLPGHACPSNPIRAHRGTPCTHVPASAVPDARGSCDCLR